MSDHTLAATTRNRPGPGEGNAWRRLDPRVIFVRPMERATHLVTLLVAALLFGEQWWVLGLNLAAAGVLVTEGLLAWLTGRYRITAHHFEVRGGLIFKHHVKVSRERIRSVDATSSYSERLLRTVSVRVGAGEREGVRLRGVSRTSFTDLRRELLKPVAHTGPTVDTEPLANFTASWVRYAPFSLSGWAAITSLGGILISVYDRIDAQRDAALTKIAINWAAHHPLWLPAIAIIAALLLVWVTGSVVVFVLAYWNFSLTREGADTLVTERGLFTTFGRAIAGHRLRGIEIVEELPARLVGAGSLNALTTGLGTVGDRVVLLPTGPIRDLRRVCARVLRDTTSPAEVELARHPRAALRRRLVRAVLVPVVAATTTTVALGPGPWLWLWVLVPAAAFLGWDRYRSLGHALTRSHLVARSGSVYRRTVALQREGIVGWRFSQSWGQRRSGLITVSALTAAGRGGYDVTDVDADHGVGLAARATPDELRDVLSRTVPHDAGSPADAPSAT